jgi:16S rRNA (guanine527-N7)-methyltransferase
VVALAGAAHVDLVESNSRKCAFLRHVIRLTGADASVREGRIEAVLPDLAADVVTARALAPLTVLLGLSAPLLKAGATGLFLKGRGFERELTEAAECWRFDADLLPSRTDPEGRIVRVTGLDERR